METPSPPSRFRRPASPDPARRGKRIRYLDPTESAIVQAYLMSSKDFDVIKDSVASRRLDSDMSLRLLPTTGWLAPFEAVTYAPWWLHLVTWLPACLAIWTWWLPHTLDLAILVGIGFIGVWPLIEYGLHRFFFHMSVAWAACLPRPLQGCINVIRLLSHTVHHAHPTDRRRIITPLPMSLAIAGAVLPPLFYVIQDRDSATALAVGIVLGYVYYDYMHYDLHLGSPVEQWSSWIPGSVKRHIQRLRRAHRNHHYAPNGHEASFGVSGTFWDTIFYTEARGPTTTTREQ